MGFSPLRMDASVDRFLACQLAQRLQRLARRSARNSLETPHARPTRDLGIFSPLRRSRSSANAAGGVCDHALPRRAGITVEVIKKLIAGTPVMLAWDQALRSDQAVSAKGPGDPQKLR